MWSRRWLQMLNGQQQSLVGELPALGTCFVQGVLQVCFNLQLGLGTLPRTRSSRRRAALGG